MNAGVKLQLLGTCFVACSASGEVSELKALANAYSTSEPVCDLEIMDMAHREWDRR